MLSLWILSQLMFFGFFYAGDAIFDGPEQLLPEVGELPYMVEILDIISDEAQACGGAIIDPTHILTAAHCLTATLKDRLIIIAGAVYLFSESRVKQQGVAEIFIHKKFAINGNLWHRVQSTRWDQIRELFRYALRRFNYEVSHQLFEYDIAILKLNEALPIGDNIKPINLPSADSSSECYLCTFAGWGRIGENALLSPRLYATQLLILPAEQCEARFIKLPSNEFCAIDPFTRSVPLEGDSGAPLVFDNIVYGLASSTHYDPRHPAIFTKVSAHLKWIRKVLKK